MAGKIAAQNRSGTTKSRLIAAASAIMREKDSISITLQEVAHQSGMNSALVRYHFGNKDGLMFAVLESDITTGLDQLERLQKRTDYGPAQKMRLHISGMVETYSRIPYLHRLIQFLTADGTKDHTQWIANEVIKKIAVGQKKILDAGVAQNLFREVDPLSFYFIVVGTADSLYSQRFVLKSAFDLDEVDAETHARNVAQITDILMRGLLVDSGSTTNPT